MFNNNLIYRCGTPYPLLPLSFQPQYIAFTESPAYDEVHASPGW